MCSPWFDDIYTDLSCIWKSRCFWGFIVYEQVKSNHMKINVILMILKSAGYCSDFFITWNEDKNSTLSVPHHPRGLKFGALGFYYRVDLSPLGLLYHSSIIHIISCHRSIIQSSASLACFSTPRRNSYHTLTGSAYHNVAQILPWSGGAYDSGQGLNYYEEITKIYCTTIRGGKKRHHHGDHITLETSM